MSTRQKKKTGSPPKQTCLLTRHNSRKPEKKTKPIQPVKSTINKELLNKNNKKVTTKKVVKHIKHPTLVEEKEYYPNKLKRKLTDKKIILKPKHNFTVIAGTNKRKLTTPQKGKDKDNSPPSPTNSDLSITEAVRMMDEASLTDEDLMEILTCPSPVWWEDPPDSEYIEDAICKLPIKQLADRFSHTDKQSPTLNIRKNKEHKMNLTKRNSEFSQKQQKLEEVLGNLKKRGRNTEVNRRISESTEGDLLSDISFNEDDILRDLENISIPIKDSEDSRSEWKTLVDTKDFVKIEESSRNNTGIAEDFGELSRSVNDVSSGINEDIKSEKLGSITVRKDLINDKKLQRVPAIMPTLTRKPLINYKEDTKTSDCFDNSGIDSISDANIRFISDDDCSNASENVKDVKRLGIDNVDYFEQNTGKSDSSNKRLVNDLTEYITVYKIMSNDDNIQVSKEKVENCPKSDKCTSELNNFFKKRKNNKRLKKEHITNNGGNELKNEFDSNELKNKLDSDNCELKKINEKENSDEKIDEQNRLKGCDYCIIKNKQGSTDFSCDTCKMAPNLACDLCNFGANTKDVIKKHASRCNSVKRISWNNNYLLNQT